MPAVSNALLGLVLLLQSASGQKGGMLPAQENDKMLVSTEWLANHLQDPDVVVLCVASGKTFYARHIPGARLVNLSEIAITREDIPNELPTPAALQKVFQDAGVSDHSRLILYGERYGLLAARAYFTLDYLGLGVRTALLNGGIEKWRTERRVESTALPKFPPGKITVRLNPDIVVSTPAMRDLLSHPNGAKPRDVRLIDARPAEEYSGERLSEGVSKSGHIPGSANVYWMANLVSRENPVLRPIAELRRLYEDAGNSKGARVITYCRTGMQSSYDYFIAKYLGYKAAMYDGSFFEWALEDLPVERDK